MTPISFFDALDRMRHGNVVVAKSRFSERPYRMTKNRLQRQGRTGRWLFSQMKITEAFIDYEWFEVFSP
jgi:hypothetical protein